MNLDPYVLFEVFGYPSNDFSSNAVSARESRVCPFKTTSAGREVPCTKASEADPLGACSLWWEGKPVVVCPNRFLGIDGLFERIAKDLLNTNSFFAIPEVPLHDASGSQVGKIDSVLIVGNETTVTDFAGVELQAVYISGNIREYFSEYISDPINFLLNKPILYKGRSDGGRRRLTARPDYLSSVKRLNYQLLYKASIYSAWKKKIAVVLQKPLWDVIAARGDDGLELVDLKDGNCDIVWYIVDYDESGKRLSMVDRLCISYPAFKRQLLGVDAGELEEYIDKLSARLSRLLSEGR